MTGGQGQRAHFRRLTMVSMFASLFEFLVF